MVDTEKSYLKEQVESLEQQVKNLQGQAMALQSQLESSKAYIAHLEHKVAFLEEEKREQSPATCFLVFLVEKFRVSIYQLKWCFVKIAARIRAEVRLQATLPDWKKAGQ